tara:strand:- start:17 stop:232 length:216 start_codon:yes stop_codon:yes gene_type:complete
MLLQKELEQQHLLMELQQLLLAVVAEEVGVVVLVLQMLVELAVEVKELLDLIHLLVEPQMEQPILAVVAVV